MSKSYAQSVLHIEKDRKVLLYFGFIRKYKGLKYLLHALPQIKKSYPEILLLVVGEFRDNKKEYLPLLENPEIKNNIQLYDKYIPDSEVGKFFIACDLLVLPYESATQTGIAPIAFGFGKPVIATEVGGLPDVIHNGQNGYLVPPCNPDALANAVIQFYQEKKADTFGKKAKEAFSEYQWDRLGETICQLVNFN